MKDKLITPGLFLIAFLIVVSFILPYLIVERNKPLPKKEYIQKVNYLIEYPSGRVDSLRDFGPGSDCKTYKVNRTGEWEIIPIGNFKVRSIR